MMRTRGPAGAGGELDGQGRAEGPVSARSEPDDDRGVQTTGAGDQRPVAPSRTQPERDDAGSTGAVTGARQGARDHRRARVRAAARAVSIVRGTANLGSRG